MRCNESHNNGKVYLLLKKFPGLLFDLRSSGKAFKAMKQMGLSGVSPLGEVKTKAPNSDYHNHRDVQPAAARQAEVAWNYLKRAAKIDELNGHPSGSDGPMATALKRHNGGRVLVHDFTPQHGLLCHIGIVLVRVRVRSSWWARSRRCQRT